MAPLLRLFLVRRGRLLRDGVAMTLEMAKRTTLREEILQRLDLRLVHSTAGWEVAGSGTRPTAEKFGVLVSMHDYNGGWWFKTLAEAQTK